MMGDGFAQRIGERRWLARFLQSLVDGTRLELVDFNIPRNQNADRVGRKFLRLFEELHSAHSWHAQIRHEDRKRSVRSESFQCGIRPYCRFDMEFPSQHSFETLEDEIVVIHD